MTQCTRLTASAFRPAGKQSDQSSTGLGDPRCIAAADCYCGMRNHRTGSEPHTHSCSAAAAPNSDSALTHSHNTVLARCSRTFRERRRSCSLGSQCSILRKATPVSQTRRRLMRAQYVACRTFKSLIINPYLI